MPPDITFLGHATVLVEMAGLRVLTDPVLTARVTFLGRVPSAVDSDAFTDVDLVLISHLHHDHCDIRSLAMVKNARVIVPAGAGEFLYRRGVRNLIELPVGDHYDMGELRITALRADHDGFRTPIGPRAEAIGYMISDQSGTNVYFAGDTDVYDQMALLPQQFGPVDTALLPVWGWGPNLGPGHMNPDRAVDALALIQPAHAMPIHWGTLFPYGLRAIRPSLSALLQTPPQDFARVANERGIDCDLVVVQPGDYAEFAR